MLCLCTSLIFFFFFFNDTATTEIYTLSLHDALPILHIGAICVARDLFNKIGGFDEALRSWEITDFVDRKSTRLNSSHANISYAVFCLKKKKKKTIIDASVEDSTES